MKTEDDFKHGLEGLIRKNVKQEDIFEYCKSYKITTNYCDYLLGSYFFSKGNYKESEKFFANTLETDLKAEALFALGRISLNKKRYDDAIHLFEKSEHLGCGRCYYWLGIIYQCGLGVGKNTERALGYYEKGANLGYVICQRADLYYSAPNKLTEKFGYLVRLSKFYMRTLKITFNNINDERLSDHKNWKKWDHREILFPLSSSN